MFLKNRDYVSYQADLKYIEGESYMNEGRFAEASSHFADALIEEPHCIEYLLSFAEANYYRGGRQCLLNAQKAIAQIPVRNIRSVDKFLPGHILQRLGRFEHARDAYFDALSSSAYVEDPELSLVHTFLSGLSERKNMKMKRPKGFRCPVLNVPIESNFKGKNLKCDLRVFEREKVDVRVLTVPSHGDVEPCRNAKLRIIREAKKYLNEPMKPFFRDDVIWIIHYPYYELELHRTEKIVFNQGAPMTVQVMAHAEFEQITGYRLIWLPEHNV